VTDLRTILSNALKDLASIWSPLALDPNLDTTCNPPQKVTTCGYPSVFVSTTASQGGQIQDSWRFLQDPDQAYVGCLINQTKIANPKDSVALSDVATQLDFHEAVIWLGCTPQVTYFGYSKLLWAMNPPLQDPTSQILGSLGDSLNNYRLKTARNNTAGTVGGGATLIIYTASKRTEKLIRDAFTKAGFLDSAINVDPFPTDLISLGKKGAFLGFGSRNSNLTLLETAYLFTPGTGYLTQNELNFPYVRLTPRWPIEFASGDADAGSISPLPDWVPNVDQTNSIPPPSVMQQSERIYEFRLLGAVQGITTLVSQKLAATGIKYNVLPQTPYPLNEYGEKYIFAHKYAQHGGAGTRDNLYYNFHPGYVPKYGGNNFSITVGLRHDSPSWKALGKANPHALFWNFVYSDSTDVGALMKFNSKDTTTVQSYTSLPALGGSATTDPLNVIYVRTTGVTSGTNANVIAALTGLGLHTPLDNPLTNIYPLTIIHHVYVNPDTGVAPWDGSICTPIQIHFETS